MKKILIIEDDAIVAHIYRTRLEKEGYEVEIAPDGQSGFYRIHEFRPDAVLLDLMLPKMNGVDILKKIRAQPQFCKTPIIVFTNAYVPNMIHESFGAGATQVFNKATLTPRQILDALHGAIQFNTTNGSAAAATDEAETEEEAGLGESPYHTPPHGHSASATAVLTPVRTASRPVETTELESARDEEFQSELL